MHPSYRFDSRWLVVSSLQRAYDVLVDVERYPEWWPQVRAVAKLGEDHALVVCRSVLPVNLYLELRPVVRDAGGGVLEVSIEGDLEGWSRFTLTPVAEGLDVHYEQEVVTHRAALHSARWLRPVVEANHAWMMRSCRKGLSAAVAALAA